MRAPTDPPAAVLHIAAALVRRDDEIAMVGHAAPGEDRFWSVPSGRVEERELVTEGLVREVREETGLEVVDPGKLAFIVQIDNRRREKAYRGRHAGGNYFATVWTFDVGEWRGTLGPDDPDGLVSDARFMPVGQAIAHLEALEWQTATVRYLRGELATGSVVVQRWHADGEVEEVATIPGPRTA